MSAYAVRAALAVVAFCVPLLLAACSGSEAPSGPVPASTSASSPRPLLMARCDGGAPAGWCRAVCYGEWRGTVGAPADVADAMRGGVGCAFSADGLVWYVPHGDRFAPAVARFARCARG